LPPHRGLASLSASGKDARQRATVIGLGAVGIVSAIEAVRDGHRVTVIEALGFEPEAFGLISDVAEYRRSTLANEANQREPKQSRIQGRTNSLQHRCFLAGRIARQTRAEFPPIEALAAPEVRIHPAPPVSLR
jgi:glycine/D-amino acid oxidase-like deaminating enzyme